MQYDNTQYEESIDLLWLIGDALRMWRFLLLAIVIGAVLLGTNKWASAPKEQENIIEKLQKELNDIYLDYYDLDAQIRGNEANIKSYLQQNSACQDFLDTQQQMKIALEETLAAQQSTLVQAQAVLLNSNSETEKERMTVVMSTAMENITTINIEIGSIDKSIQSTINQILTNQNSADTLTIQNEPLREQADLILEDIAELEENLEDVSNASPIGSVIKYAIFGGILGACFVCGIILLQYLFKKELHTSAELKERYRLSVLGEFYSEKIKIRGNFGNFVNKLMSNVQTLPEEKQVYQLIAASIQTQAASLPVQLAVTGTVDSDMLHTVGEQLRAVLPKDYNITVIANPLGTMEFIVNLKQYAVLLVEAKCVSDRYQIDILAENLCRNGANVVGAVVK